MFDLHFSWNTPDTRCVFVVRLHVPAFPVPVHTQDVGGHFVFSPWQFDINI